MKALTKGKKTIMNSRIGPDEEQGHLERVVGGVDLGVDLGEEEQEQGRGDRGQQDGPWSGSGQERRR